MKAQRLKSEVGELKQDYPVKWSVKKQYVMITKFGYPKGWTPRTAPLFFDLPSTYPRHPPEVYLPPDAEYKKGPALHQLSPNNDGWYKWCIDEIDWDPESHSLHTMTELMKRSLRKPNAMKIV